MTWSDPLRIEQYANGCFDGALLPLFGKLAQLPLALFMLLLKLGNSGFCVVECLLSVWRAQRWKALGELLFRFSCLPKRLLDEALTLGTGLLDLCLCLAFGFQ